MTHAKKVTNRPLGWPEERHLGRPLTNETIVDCKWVREMHSLVSLFIFDTLFTYGEA